MKLASLVKKHKCVVVIQDENDPEFEKTLGELIKNKEIYRANGLKLVEDYLELERCSNKFVGIYKELS